MPARRIASGCDVAAAPCRPHTAERDANVAPVTRSTARTSGQSEIRIDRAGLRQRGPAAANDSVARNLLRCIVSVRLWLAMWPTTGFRERGFIPGRNGTLSFLVAWRIRDGTPRAAARGQF